MVDRFVPLDYHPYGMYDVRYWNIFTPDIIKVIFSLGAWAYTGRVSTPPEVHIIGFCGNPKCLAPFGYYKNSKPSVCAYCESEIKWESK